MDGVSGSPYTFRTIMSDGQLEKLAAIFPSIDNMPDFSEAGVFLRIFLQAR